MTFPAVELRALPDDDRGLEMADVQPRAALPSSQATRGVIILGGAHGSVAVARSLGRRGIPVWFVGNDHPIARYSRYTVRSLNWPGVHDPKAVEYLCALARNEGAQGWVLFPAADAELQLVSQNLAQLSQHFGTFTMAWDVLQQVNDKAQLYRLAAQLDVPSPRIYEDATPADAPAMTFPVVIKPRSNEKQNALTRDKVWRADDAATFERRWNDAMALMDRSEFVVQEMVPGDGATQFSYAALWADGKEVSSLVVRRLRQFPADFGTSPFVETVEVVEIPVTARRLLAGIGFSGLVEMDFKFDARDGLYKVLDVNTRVWAWIGLGAATGHDFPWLAWQIATGEKVAPPANTQPGRWVYSSHNLLSVLQQLKRERRLDPSVWRSLFLPSISATLSWDDPLPGLLEFPILLPRLLRRLRTGRAA